MTRILVISLLAGCYGGGDAPPAATGVTPLFAVPPPSGNACNNSVYIGGVAVGAMHGYAVTVPYIPSGPDTNCCGGGMCPMPNGGLFATYSFDKTGANPQGTNMGPLSVSGNGDNDYPYVRVAIADGDTPVWAFDASGQIVLSNGATISGQLSGNINGVFEPAAITADPTSIYVAGWSPSGQSVEDPGYPCCGGMNNNQGMGQSALAQVDLTTKAVTYLPVSPQFACETAARCMTESPDHIIYFDQSAMGVVALPKTATTAAQQQPLGALGAQGLVPVGLASNMMYAAWAESTDYRTTNNGATPGQCAITMWDLSASSGQQVFATSKFSCMGVALDGATAYTTIVTPYSGDCGGCSPELKGIGIARFSLTNPTGTFEALDLHVNGAVGPRRLTFDSDGNLYLIDPDVVLAIDKTALAGKHDFTP